MRWSTTWRTTNPEKKQAFGTRFGARQTGKKHALEQDVNLVHDKPWKETRIHLEHDLVHEKPRKKKHDLVQGRGNNLLDIRSGFVWFHSCLKQCISERTILCSKWWYLWCFFYFNLYQEKHVFLAPFGARRNQFKIQVYSNPQILSVLCQYLRERWIIANIAE